MTEIDDEKNKEPTKSIKSQFLKQLQSVKENFLPNNQYPPDPAKKRRKRKQNNSWNVFMSITYPTHRNL